MSAALNIILSVHPEHLEAPVFVELETDDRRSIAIGTHSTRDDGLTAIRITLDDFVQAIVLGGVAAKVEALAAEQERGAAEYERLAAGYIYPSEGRSWHLNRARDARELAATFRSVLS